MGSYLLPRQYNMGTYLWPYGHNMPFVVVCCVRKLMTLKYGFQGQHRWNVKTNLNSLCMVSCLLPIQYGHLSLTVWPQHAIKRSALCMETDDLEVWVSRSTRLKCKVGFELAAYGFLFAPHNIWALISDRLAPTRHLSLCAKSGKGWPWNIGFEVNSGEM